MKVAIIHDSLTEFGGAERVLSEFLEIFPGAKVFTSHYKKDLLAKHFPHLNSNRLIVSWYQHLPRKTTTMLQFLSPLIWRFKNLENFDLIITNSAYYLSPIATIGIKTTPVIHYLLSLPKNLFGLEQKTFWQKKLTFSYQKSQYCQSLKKSPHLITISQHIQCTVKKMTGFNSRIIYPPVSIPPLPSFPKDKKKYFLIVSRIDSTKGLELAIKACHYLNLPLKIAGETNDPLYLEKLKKLAGKETEFLGFVSDKERIKLYQRAIAFLFCSKNEDFGIAPVEAMAHGMPVIAYYGGGAKETIIQGKTGLFFYRHSWQSLLKAIKKFDKYRFDPVDLYRQAQRFSREKFRKRFLSYLKENHLLEKEFKG